LSSLFRDPYARNTFPFFSNSFVAYLRKNLHFVLLSALAVCAGLCGCGGVATNPAQSGALTPSTTSVSFGDVPVGQAVSSAVSLSNQGTGTIEVSQLAVSGGAFALDSQVTLPISVPSGGAVSVNLKFDPSSMGSSDGQLTVTSNSSAPTAMVRLHGNGTSPLASLSCTSPSMTGAGTDACTVTLTSRASNGGQVVSLLSNNAAVIVPSTVTVPAQATTAGFTATVQTVTSAQTASLTASVAKNSETFSIALNPVQSTLTISSSSVNFGTVAVGSVSTQSVTLSSTGNTAVTVSSGSVTGSGFKLIGASFPMTLNPGQSASLAVQFDPTAAGISAGQITLSSNSSTGSTTTIGLSGTTSPVLSALSCGTSSFTGAGSDACTITLSAAAPTGGTVVSLSSNQTAVTVPSSVTVSAGSTSAGFTATVSSVSTSEVAALTATLGTVAQTSNIQLHPATSTLSVSTSTIAFGNVNVGQTATQSLTLSSTGAAPVTISSISVAGSLFTVTGITAPLTLNPGQTATMGLQFYSSQVGNSTGVVTVASNSSQGSVVINMTGAGVSTSTLNALSCSTASFTGAGTDSCTVTLSGSAPSSGLTVNLSSNNAAVTVPATVTVPSGATSAGFSPTVSSVTSPESVTLTASSGTATQGFAIQLNPGTSILGISSSSANFGSVALNTTVSQSLTLTSTGTGPVNVTSAAISGAGFTSSGITLPLTLNPGQTATLNIQFDPTTSGTATGQIAIASNSSTGASTTVTLSGTGLASLKSLSCGNASMTGAGTDACTVTLNGLAPSGGMVVTLASNNTAVVVPASVTVPANAASAAFSATVTAVGTAQTASITASAGSATQNFALQLNAAAGSLSLSTSSISYGNVNIGSTATAPVVLTSTGNVPVIISGISVAGTLFGATGIAAPITLNPGQTATLTASFSPLVANPWNYTGTITITSNASTNPSAVVNMSGAGVAPSTLSALSCGTGSYAGAGTDACTVSLTGAAPSGGFAVALSSNNSSVTVPASVTVASGATSAAFSSSVSAVTTSQSATITATAGGLTQTFAIQLGTAVGSLSVNASSVPFGGIVVNSTAAQSVTLTAGASPVTVSAASITGTGFSVSGMTFPVTLNAGQTATLNIEFAPLASGSYTGQLTISSNCAGGSISVSLSGTGDPHEVQLSWDPPSGSTVPVVGYNIYRAVAGNPSYVLINTAEDSQTTYLDATVVHATSYVYYVVSVDSSGVQSVASNTTSVTIP
jgi:hypothetical protein